MLRGMDLQRVWLGVAELGMAMAGLVVGRVVVGALFAAVDVGALQLTGGVLATALAGAFYAWVGPRWAEATRGERAEAEPVAELAAPSRAWGRVAATVGLGILAALGGSIVLGLALEAVGLGVEEQARVVEIAEGARGGRGVEEAVVLAVSALLMAPLAEEWLFRRLFFTRLLGTSGRGMAYLLSALGFAAIHGNPAGIVIYAWLGVVFAVVLERTGRWSAAAGVHMGNNAYVLAVLFFGGGGGG